MNTSNRLLATLFVSQSLFSASHIAIFTLLSIVAVKLSGSESTAGLPSSTLTLSQAVAAYPIGLIMGRFGRRIGLSFGYSAALIGSILGILAIMQGIFPLLLLSAMLLGVGRAGADQSRFAAGEIYPEALRARMIGRIVFAGTVGAISGPLLVGPGSQLASQMGLNPDTGPWLIATALYIFAILITFMALRPDPSAVARQIEQGEEKIKNEQKAKSARSLREILKNPAVQLAMLSMLISQVAMVTLMVITPLHMSHLDYTNDAVSLVISGHTLGMFGLSGLTGYLIDRYGRVTMMMIAAVTLLAAAIIAPMSTALPVLVLALFLLGLGWNFGFIAGSSMLADALHGEERARVQGFNDMFVAGAAGLSSLSSGPLFAAGGYLAVSLMGLILTMFFMVMIRRLTPPIPTGQPA